MTTNEKILTGAALFMGAVLLSKNKAAISGKKKRHLYMEEFGSDYHVPTFIKNSSSWIDTSWHNDSSPSFQHKWWNVKLWIDNENGNSESGKFYSIQQTDQTGNGISDVFSTNSEDELKRIIKAYERFESNPRTQAWTFSKWYRNKYL